MELIDIYDENDNYMNYSLERKEVHDKNLWHHHVSAWIMNYKGQVLLQQRALNKKKNPGKWAKTGGHVDAGETCEEAIKREIYEEIGLEVNNDAIKNIEIFKSNNPNEHYFSYGYIFFTDEVSENSDGSIITRACNSQLEVFSPHIADLLVRCCVEIEAISKELYFDNGGTKKRGDSTIMFDTDCLKLIDIKWQTHTKKVMVVAPSFNFTKEENRVLRPLKEAHKQKGTSWERAYQAVKHDRFASLHMGTVKAFLHALAALYLLNIYYRNIVEHNVSEYFQ